MSEEYKVGEEVTVCIESEIASIEPDGTYGVWIENDIIHPRRVIITVPSGNIQSK